MHRSSHSQKVFQKVPLEERLIESVKSLSISTESEELPPIGAGEEEPESLWVCEIKEHLEAFSRDKPQVFFSLEVAQPFMTPSMRAMLLDWMMEVCSEFTLKRETFHLAMAYVDRALQNYPDIPKQQFQLVGLASMVIAGKIEEIYPPRAEDWAKSADDGYSLAEIRSMERGLLKALNWKIFPVTAHNWLNILLTEWDKFIDFHFGCVPFNNPKDFKPGQSKKGFFKRFIVFKQPNKYAYKRFRTVMQLLDLACLNFEVLKFSPEEVAVGLLFLVVGESFRKSEYELLYFDGDGAFAYDPVESPRIVQDLFEEFVAATLNLKNLKDCFACIQFLSQLLTLPYCFDLPLVCNYKTKQELEEHYEDFLAFQTHNPNNMDFVGRFL